jgi:4-hydroxybenzoyl-CoA reductase subunit beta
MLRLPRFDVVAPDSVAGVVEALGTPGSRLIAGGTDILPNLKHRLDHPPLLVSLTRLGALRYVRRDEDAGELRIGAGVTLTELSRHSVVRDMFPSLAHAAGVIASPLIRNMGTIGGNVNLDTRCRYVNQSEFWRSSINGCLKASGDLCYVVPKGKSCVAAMSSDCVPVLITLDASIVNVGPAGEREISVEDYYNSDGVAHLNILPGEVTTEIRVPLPQGARRASYSKWTVRKSIDFPLVSVAVRFDLESDHESAPITGVKVCVGVLASKPKIIKRVDSLIGRTLADPATADALADLVYKQGKPVDNVPYESDYRRKMLPVYTRRAIRDSL